MILPHFINVLDFDQLTIIIFFKAWASVWRRSSRSFGCVEEQVLIFWVLVLIFFWIVVVLHLLGSFFWGECRSIFSWRINRWVYDFWFQFWGCVWFLGWCSSNLCFLFWRIFFKGGGYRCICAVWSLCLAGNWIALYRLGYSNKILNDSPYRRFWKNLGAGDIRAQSLAVYCVRIEGWLRGSRDRILWEKPLGAKLHLSYERRLPWAGRKDDRWYCFLDRSRERSLLFFWVACLWRCLCAELFLS